MKKYKYFSLTKKCKKILLLNILKNNKKITLKEMGEKINITKGMISKYLKSLIKQNYIKKETNRYIVTDSGEKYITENISSAIYEFEAFKSDIGYFLNSFHEDNLYSYYFG